MVKMKFYIKLKQRFYLDFYFWPIFSILLTILILPFLTGLYPMVRFTEEQITINVYPDHVIVKGLYVYKNPFPFPVVQGFSIPFSVDQDHPDPIHISVRTLSPEKKFIPIRYILGKHRFDLHFQSKEKVLVHVQYSQHTSVMNARYLLTTTKPWRRPLIKGTYRLFTENVKIIDSNYLLKPDKTKIFSFERKNFMPNYDWEFSWEILKS